MLMLQPVGYRLDCSEEQEIMLTKRVQTFGIVKHGLARAASSRTFVNTEYQVSLIGEKGFFQTFITIRGKNLVKERSTERRGKRTTLPSATNGIILQGFLPPSASAALFIEIACQAFATARARPDW
jgi:hypothetical protein